MCTFWRFGTFDEGDDEENDGGYDSESRSYQEAASSKIKEPEKIANSSSSSCQQTSAAKQRTSPMKKRIFWSLFICKNLLLIIFGILGLITGSWISISQLSSAYLGLESAS